MPRNPSSKTIPSLTADERETIILMDDGTDVAKISTHQKRILTKLKNNPAAKFIEDLTCGSSAGASFEIDASLISFRSRRTKRPLTPEAKKAQEQRARKAQKASVAARQKK